MMSSENTLEVKRAAQKLMVNLIIVSIVLVFIAGQGTLWAEEPRSPQLSTTIENGSESIDPASTSDRETQPTAANVLTLAPSTEVQKWVERYEALADGTRKWQFNRQEADTFYNELNDFLGTKRNEFRAALEGVPSSSSEQIEAVDQSSSPPQLEGEDVASSEPPSEVDGKVDQFEHFRGAKQSSIDLITLYDLRIKTLPLISSELHDKVTGAGLKGVEAFKDELDYFILNLSYRATLAPQIIKQATTRGLSAPIPVLQKIVQLAVVVLLFIWWRRWAKESIPRIRRSILDITPRKPIHGFLAKTLRYINHIRAPLEWLILLLIVLALGVSEDMILINLLATKAKYILLAWLIVVFLDALLATRTADLQSPSARLRLRSIWLVAGWVLLASLGLDLTETMVGKGTIYAWTRSATNFLLIPVGIVLIYWWRPELYLRIDKIVEPPTYLTRITRKREGLMGFLGAICGAVYLFVDWCRLRLLKLITHFEWGHHFVAYMTRIEAIRASDRQQEKIEGTPLPEETRQRLYQSAGGVVETVGQEILTHLIGKVRQRQSGIEVVVAERGGGKTQLFERLDGLFEDKMVLLDCPPGGLTPFKETIAQTFDLKVSELSAESLTERLREQRVAAIGIDNMHRMCRPALGGQHDLNRVGELIRAIEAKVFWIFGFDWAGWQYISRVRSDHLFVDSIWKLSLWKEHEIRDLLEMRSAYAGIKPDFNELDLSSQFEDFDYDSIEERNRFAFSRIIWNAAEGNPAVALQLWADSLRILNDGRTIITFPPLPSTNELENSHISILLLLRVVAQSGYANQEEITDSLDLSEIEVAAALRHALVRNWIECDQGRYRLTWVWFRSVIRVLARQNLLVRRTLGELS